MIQRQCTADAGDRAAQIYAAYTWPRAFAGVFFAQWPYHQHHGRAQPRRIHPRLCRQRPPSLFGVHTDAGAFYRLIPHNAMAAVRAAFLYAIAALVMRVAHSGAISTTIGMRTDTASILGHSRCRRVALSRRQWRRLLQRGRSPNRPPQDFHHLTFYGFGLCFAATCVATLYHYLFAREAPIRGGTCRWCWARWAASVS
jgi:citrate/tricarballylate utilization protein